MFARRQYQNDVFISYNPANQPWVQDYLLPRLEEAGLKVIVGYRDYQVGVPKLVNVERAMDTSRYTLAVITPAWLEATWEEFEGLLAQASDPAGRRRRLIPLLLEPSRLPPRLAMLTSADFTGSGEQSEAEMLRLLAGFRTKSRVFLSFKRGIEPDEPLAFRLCEELEREGHKVYTNHDVTVGMSSRREAYQQIALSDYLVVLISAASAAETVIADHIEYAHLMSARAQKARLLPVRINYNEALPNPIGNYLKDFGYAVWRNVDDNERVIRKLLDAMTTFATLSSPVAKAEDLTSEALASPSKLWVNGSVINIAFLDGDPALQWKVAKVSSEWTKYANLRFVFGDVSDAAIRVSFKEPGSWSYQGTDVVNVSKDQPTTNFGWLTPTTPEQEIRRVVLHEFGHALGLVHEHQLATAQIPWDKEAVYRDLAGPPNNWTKQQIDLTMFQKYNPDYFPVEKEFDPKSIMIFPIPKYWTNDKLEVGWNGDLSDIDKKFVQRLYPST